MLAERRDGNIGKWQNAFGIESDLNELRLLCNMQYTILHATMMWGWAGRGCPRSEKCHLSDQPTQLVVRPIDALYNLTGLFRNHLQTISLCWQAIKCRWWSWWWWIGRCLVTFGIDSGWVCPIDIRVTNRLSSPWNRNTAIAVAACQRQPTSLLVRGHLIRTRWEQMIPLSYGICIAIIQVAGVHTTTLIRVSLYWCKKNRLSTGLGWLKFHFNFP